MHRPAPHLRSIIILASALLFAAVLFCFLPTTTHAAGVNAGLTPAVSDALGLGTEDVRVTVAKIIRAAFALLGIVFVVIVLYGGFLWMTAAGNEEQIDKARKIITNGVIGLAIMLAALAITQFAIQVLTGEGGGGAGGSRRLGGGSGSGGGFGVGATFAIPQSGALGNGIVVSHTPERGAQNVPRNVRISITFREPMQLGSLIRGYNDQGTPDDISDDYPSGNAPTAANTDVIQIFPTTGGVAAALNGDAVQVRFTPDRRTYTFVTPLLGSPSEDVSYTVKIGTAARTAEGASAFTGSFASGYQWDFTTSSVVDVTPPQVRMVVPRQNQEHPRNTLIQLYFSEPMDPTTLTGILPDFANVSVTSGAGAGLPVAGSGVLASRYETWEFVSNDRCATNACGGDIFCLPAATTMHVTVRAASLSDTPPAADLTLIPPDGATDMAGNSLDGNGDGQSTGPGSDDYVFQFRTSQALDTTSPVIEHVAPDLDASAVAPDAAVSVRFSKLMSVRSFTNEALSVQMVPAPDEPTCYDWYARTVTADGQPSDDGVKTEAVLSHCLFAPNTSYIPQVTSAVRDTRQNCYVPAATSPDFGRCSPGDAYCCNGNPSATACQITPAGGVIPGR